MKKLLASIFAVFAFGMAAAQPPMGPPPGMMPGMGPGERGPRKSPEERIAHVTKELGLTEKQAKKAADLFRKNILERGGTAKPMELYRAFRGGEPSIDALLERDGITKK